MFRHAWNTTTSSATVLVHRSPWFRLPILNVISISLPLPVRVQGRAVHGLDPDSDAMVNVDVRPMRR